MRNWFIKNIAPIGFFILLTGCLVCKGAIWHMQFFWDKEIPLLGYVWMSVLMASSVLLCRRRPWWILVLLAAVNIWLFSNFAYERAWGKMLSMDMIRMTGNLRGFEDSVLTFFHRDMLYWLVVPDVLCCVALAFWRKPEMRLWKAFLSTILLLVLLIPYQQSDYYRQIYWRQAGYNNNTGLAHWWHIHEPLFNLFAWEQQAAYDAFMFQESQNWERPFVHSYGIYHFGPALCAFDARYRRFERSTKGEAIDFSPEQKEQIALLTGPEPAFHPQRSLVLILVESLESWAIDYPLGDGFVMPNLHEFIHSHPVWYSPRTYCQLGYGGSSDGQLMALTGLTPIRHGVTVALYGDQLFPNYAHFFPRSITLNPSPGTWKQHVVNPNYGIQTLEESDSIRDDAGIFKRLNTIDLSEPTFVLAITVSSHVPFAKANEINLPLDSDMPETMAKYLKCLHYMDKHLGTFLDRIDSDPNLKMTDVVITGDHPIFFSQEWQMMKEYAVSKDIHCLDGEHNTTMLMLYSPLFSKQVFYDKPSFQMDIYPSVLHMIGCDAPAWRGVGMDMLGSSPRIFGTEEASDLCDKLIRSDYFAP